MTAYKRVSNAIASLRDEVNRAHPGRVKISDGYLGDTAHSARTSDHNPDGNGIVHAMDVTVWDDADPDNLDDVAQPLAEFLRAKRDPRTKYVIHRGRMFSSYASGSRAAWQWGPYTGANGHFHHVHVSVYGDNGAPWGYSAPRPVTPPKPSPPTPGDLDMAIARRDPRDQKIWLIGGTGREHIPNRQLLNERIMFGVIASVPPGTPGRENDFVAMLPREGLAALDRIPIIAYKA